MRAMVACSICAFGTPTTAYAVTYTYDLADRLLTMTYPSGRIVTYLRDAQGKITGVTTKANATATLVTLAAVARREH